jgi:O-antigen ligase
MRRRPTNLLSRSKRGLASFFSINEVAVALWAACTFPIMIHTGGQTPSALFPPLVLGAAAFLFLTWNKPVIARIPQMLTLGVLLLNFSIVASYLFNAERYEAVFMIGNIVSSVLAFISLYTITMKMDLDFRKTLILQCLFSSPLFISILRDGVMTWGRLIPANLEPNYVGMMALLCFMGAIGVRSWIAAAALSALPVYTMLVVQSRASMLAALLSVVIIGVCALANLSAKKLRLVLPLIFLGGPALCIALILAGVPVFAFFGGIVDNTFMLSDEHRGISSGGSGRTDLWTAAINLWLSHPLFGVGFKGHPLMMPDQMLAHNAFLGMLADVGLVGCGSYLLILCVAVYYILKRGRDLSEFPLRLAIIFSYLLYGMFESRAFSFGNTYSILFLLVAFDSSKIRIKKAATSKQPESKRTPVLRESPSLSLQEQNGISGLGAQRSKRALG